MDLDDVFDSLPVELHDDVLIDCASMTIDLVDAARLVEEILVRRSARTLTLLVPNDDLAAAAAAMATSVGRREQLRLSD